MNRALVLFVVLLAADAATTVVGLALGADEGNRAVRGLINTTGVLPALLISRAVALLILAFGAWTWPRLKIAPFNVMWAAVVVWNLAQIARLAR